MITNRANDSPDSCIKQTWREHFQSLVMRVLSELDGLLRTLPSLKSSKVDKPWYFTSEGSATRLYQYPRRVCSEGDCNVKVYWQGVIRQIRYHSCHSCSGVYPVRKLKTF
jgi:hypothetical protein